MNVTNYGWLLPRRKNFLGKPNLLGDTAVDVALASKGLDCRVGGGGIGKRVWNERAREIYDEAFF
jgi:hypothetical protein